MTTLSRDTVGDFSKLTDEITHFLLFWLLLLGCLHPAGSLVWFAVCVCVSL
uniref:Uncharacterized protein n=1 Tax=Anguilla anguilla TaxID=7936 RepID=A0A0E9Y0J7_ANGAN